MRRIYAVMCIAVMLTTCNAANAQGTKQLLEIRQEFFNEYESLEQALNSTKDTAIIYVMWDSCRMAIIQLDAYFSMVGIMESLKGRGLNDRSVNYIVMWLEEMDRANKRHITHLKKIRNVEKETIVRIDRLLVYFKKLGSNIEYELKRLSRLRELLLQETGDIR